MRFKIVACMLSILPAFIFVLATPIPVREVRDMRADAMEGDEDIIIVAGKRAPPEDPYDLTGSDLSGVEWGASSTPGHDVGLSSGGSASPLWSKVWSSPGGTEVPEPWHQEGTFKPDSTTENKPTSTSNIKTVQWGPTTENQLPSSSEAKAVQWGPTTKVFMYAKDPLPSPPGREAYLAKLAAQTLPQPKSFSSKVKTFFGNLKHGLKHGNLKFRPRFQRTSVDSGV